LKPLDAVEKLRDSFGTEPEFEAHADTIKKRTSAKKSRIKKNRDLAENRSLMNNYKLNQGGLSFMFRFLHTTRTHEPQSIQVAARCSEDTRYLE